MSGSPYLRPLTSPSSYLWRGGEGGCGVKGGRGWAWVGERRVVPLDVVGDVGRQHTLHPSGVRWWM